MSSIEESIQSSSHAFHTLEFAKSMDQNDSLASMRDCFHIPLVHPYDPEVNATQCTYLCGNSLGLQPKNAEQLLSQEMKKWQLCGVEGHFLGERPWARIDEEPTQLMVPIVGAAHPDEIAIMNSLSVNLHLLLVSFYRPSGQRFKVLMENDAFCSDHHIIRSQVEYHGYKVEDAIILMKPRDGESHLRTEDIVSTINQHGDSIALVFFPGIQFYTGQFFDLKTITKAAHAKGCYAGFDLAHAVGNVPLQLHDWNVDFAAWCSYKYLNSGAGSISGIFVHSNHNNKSNEELPKFAGWWGQALDSRFSMKSQHVPKPGAQSYMLSNPPILPTVCLVASLQMFHKAGGINTLRNKSYLLTGYLEKLIKHYYPECYNLLSESPVKILTPSNPTERGCQLSLLFNQPSKPINKKLELCGIICDVREPNVIRVSPTPLYNTFTDVYNVITTLVKVLEELKAN